MELKRQSKTVYGLLAGVWLVVAGWQCQEHFRVAETAKSDLRNRSREIASTLSAVTRALRFRGAIFQERLEPVLNELVSNRTNALVSSSGLMAVSLLNTEGNPMVTAGDTNLLSREISAEREHWSDACVTFVLPLAGASVGSDNASNATTVVLPPFHELTNDPAHSRDFSRRPAETNLPPPAAHTNAAGEIEPVKPPTETSDRPRSGGSRRPPWLRGMTEAEFKAFTAKRELHALVLVMSTENFHAVSAGDWWLRAVVGFFAGISALGVGLAWRNMARTAELQIRLVRASEQNTHLKELNLAAAGLAHETRNPLNLIRGLAQMVSRLPDAPPEVRDQTKTIVDEADKVTAQLTEFINYSKPREVRRTKLVLTAAANEILRTLGHDIAEKKLRVEVAGEPLAVEADEQLLRQVLFNLLINATMAVGENGNIQIVVRRAENQEAVLEVRDDGPGVPPENRREIFKPYFTTHQKGTGLGLAVVQQIVLAHGWEIQCLANEPRGAVFRLSHLKLAA